MNKHLAFMATTAATLFFLFCVFAVVAAADELALAPFYYTLPVSALLVNATWLFFLLRKRDRLKAGRAPFAWFPSRAIFSRGLRWGGQQPQPAGGPYGRASKVGQRRSPQEIRAALNKVHSVVLGYPRKHPNVLNQKEHANDEAHR